MSKRANNLQDTNYPLVSVQRFQSLKCDVNTRQVERKDMGREKPPQVVYTTEEWKQL